MKTRVKKVVKWVIPLFVIGIVGVFRAFPGWAEWYARACYPRISTLLSAFSDLFPFSVGDCFLVAAVLWVIVYPFYAWRKNRKAKQVLSNLVLFFMWIYIWFYFAWGINYFRYSFYERTHTEPASYAADAFREFIKDYVGRLNAAFREAGDTTAGWYLEPYVRSATFGSLPVEQILQENYREIAPEFGLVHTGRPLRAKWMLWSKGMSKVAITGYMGPFFSEFNLNRELLNVEYPFTYAHELAHRLGIASEAEANLYAYLVTTAASLPEIRFSGYFSLLGYTMSNARNLLTPEEYSEVVGSVRPEIIELYRAHLKYWREKYRPEAGRIQNKIYNAYLKSNQVTGGTKNYSEVIGLLMSIRNKKNHSL